jgi:hypothetical protein
MLPPPLDDVLLELVLPAKIDPPSPWPPVPVDDVELLVIDDVLPPVPSPPPLLHAARRDRAVVDPSVRRKVTRRMRGRVSRRISRWIRNIFTGERAIEVPLAPSSAR